MSEQPEALRLADILTAISEDPMWACHGEIDKITAEKTAAELRRLHAVNAELLGALRQSVDLAEYWFLKVDRRNLSESEHKIWHALGYGSSAYKAARAVVAKAEGVTP